MPSATRPAATAAAPPRRDAPSIARGARQAPDRGRLAAALAALSAPRRAAAPRAPRPRGPGPPRRCPRSAPPYARPRRRHAGPTVSAALGALLHSGAITEAVYRQDFAAYTAAKRSLGRLSGTRRTELGAVLANVQAIAAAGESHPLAPARPVPDARTQPPWWTTEPLLSRRVAVSFPPSKLVWEYYAGQGIEIQWLGTFGEANGYYLSGHENANLRQLLSEVIPLATQRAGGIAWEYMFRFDGGVAAVDERPLAGHRPAGARARLLALQGTGLPDRRPAGARHLPDRAAAGRARRDRRRGATTPSTPTPPATASSTASSRPLVGLYDYTVDHQGPARAEAVRSRRRRGARRGPPLRHRRLVAV